MPVSAPIDSQHPSAPAYKVIDAVVIPSAGVHTSEAVDCGAYEEATVYLAPGGNGTVNVQVSLDEASWFILVQHIDTAGTTTYTSTGLTMTARRVVLGGARFVRLQFTNTAGANNTVSAWISLQSVP